MDEWTHLVFEDRVLAVFLSTQRGFFLGETVRVDGRPELFVVSQIFHEIVRNTHHITVYLADTNPPPAMRPTAD
jgi:hypothetical protein